MYVPQPFEVTDQARLADFMAQYSFATVISRDETDLPFASHLPLLYEAVPNEPGRLCGHLARANPQSRHLELNREVLVIFHGPHAYVSPRWYATAPAVPTWSYAVVHAYGTPAVFDDPLRLEELVRRMAGHYEVADATAPAYELPADFMARQLKAIIGFAIRLTRVEGKFKLGQNRSLSDRQSVFRALQSSGQPEDLLLAQFMKRSGVAG